MALPDESEVEVNPGSGTGGQARIHFVLEVIPTVFVVRRVGSWISQKGRTGRGEHVHENRSDSSVAFAEFRINPKLMSSDNQEIHFLDGSLQNIQPVGARAVGAVDRATHTMGPYVVLLNREPLQLRVPEELDLWKRPAPEIGFSLHFSFDRAPDSVRRKAIEQTAATGGL
jgi:hypothetical protein